MKGKTFLIFLAAAVLIASGCGQFGKPAKNGLPNMISAELSI
jgi:hypothetical protein